MFVCELFRRERREEGRDEPGMAELVQRIDASTASYSDFADVMKKNQPTILHSFAGLLPFFLPWQSGGRANVDFLRREYGDMQVPVVECSSSDGYGEERRMTMTLREYLDAVHDGKIAPAPGDGSGSGEHGAVLYLKDWHFQRLIGEGAAAPSAVTETPCFFRDDWLNWWCDTQGLDDYRFVYVGPPGSFTGLHHDVLNSFSWSYNVCGRKHWTLFPPEATADLYDRNGRELAKDVRTGRADPDKFPRLDAAPRLEVLQGPGEAIFVPSGWHHQVVNVGDGSADGGGLTVSVNTNWFNGFNLERVHAFLRSELSAVRAALGHLRAEMSTRGRGEQEQGGEGDWERQCELVMRANSGLNVSDFARMLTARARHLLARDCAAPAAGVLEEVPGAPLPRPAPRPDAVAAVGTGRVDDSGRGHEDKTDEHSERRRRGVDGGGRGGAWKEARWRTLALEQIAAVLRELSAAPAIDHIFLSEDGDADDRGFRNAGRATSTPGLQGGRRPGEGGVEEGGGRSSDLQETLQAVEAYLSSRRSPSRTLGPPIV